MDILRFILRQLCRRQIWLMILATFTMALMFAWRGQLRNEMWWDA